MEGDCGDHTNILLFVERMLGHVWLYEERYWVGGRGRRTGWVNPILQKYSNIIEIMQNLILLGVVCRLMSGCPPPPPLTSTNRRICQARRDSKYQIRLAVSQGWPAKHQNEVRQVKVSWSGRQCARDVEKSVRGGQPSIGWKSVTEKAVGRAASGVSLPLQSFSSSNLACNLCHVDSKKQDAMEGLIQILYDRFDNIVFWPDLAKIFIFLGGNLNDEWEEQEYRKI